MSILVGIPHGKDGTIVLQEHKTYLFFANRSDSLDKSYKLFSRSHGAIRMHFEDTGQLLSYAEHIKNIKSLINDKK